MSPRHFSDSHPNEEEVRELRRRLTEAEQTLQAIRNGEVDALIIKGPQGEQVFSLTGADHIYRVIIETMNEAAVTLSDQGTILFCNRRFCELMLTPMETVIGQEFMSFVPSPQQAHVEDVIARAASLPMLRTTLLSSDGRSIPVQLCASSLQSFEGPSVCLVASDLSELEASVTSVGVLREKQEALEQAQADLAERNAELTTSRTAALHLMDEAVAERFRAQQTAEALRDSEDRLRAFTGQLEQTVAHRTVELTKSQERMRLLATELNLAEQRERRRMAMELHDHLAQLLTLSKLKLGQGKRLASPSACADLLQEADDVLSEALAYTRTLVAELSPPALREHGLVAGLKWLAKSMARHAMEVTVDAGQQAITLPEDQTVLLFQSVRELLMNCLKHASTNAAQVILVVRDGLLRVEVRDQGSGFELAAADDDTSPVLSSKFGLFSIRERMKALGGTFTLQSAPDRGTTATLTLPLLGQVPPPVQRTTFQSCDTPLGVSQTVEGRPAAVHSRIRVLLVDDHRMVRQGLKTILENYENLDIVGEASNGEEALVSSESLHPDIVVMDINMPVMNGIDATTQLKARFPDVLVIGISVNVGEDNQVAMKQAGAISLITKEAAVDTLYDTIQTAIHGKKRQPTAQL